MWGVEITMRILFCSVFLSIAFLAPCTSAMAGEGKSTNETSPENQPILEMMRQNRWTSATMALTREIERRPGDAYLWFLQGNCARRQEDYKTAGEAYRKCLELDPDQNKARFNLALLRSFPGAPDYHLVRAIEEMEEVLRRDPAHPAARYYLGNFLRRNEKFERAEEVLRDSMKSEPSDWRAWTELARLYFKQKRLEEAQAALADGRARFGETVDWAAQEREVTLEWVKEEMRKSEYTLAARALAELRRQFPEDKELLFLDTFILMDSGDVKKAEKQFKALLGDPKWDEAAKTNLARIYALEGTQLETAKAYIGEIQKKYRIPSAQMHILWMLIYAKEGKPEVARNSFIIAGRLLNYTPDDPELGGETPESLPEEFQYAAALLEWKQGKPEEASRWLSYLNPKPSTLLFRYVEALKKQASGASPQ